MTLLINDMHKERNVKNIIKFKLPMISDVRFIAMIVEDGYRATGNKFNVVFHGSKGYLSHIEINAEGSQAERTNIIWLRDLFTTNGALKKKSVSVDYCEKRGVFVTI